MPLPEGFNRPLYIGDGVYVRFDGYHIWLETYNQPELHQIAIEPAVWSALVNYQASLSEALAKGKGDE